MPTTKSRWKPAHRTSTILGYLTVRETHREPSSDTDPVARIYSTHLPEGAVLGEPVAHVELGAHRSGHPTAVYPLTLADGTTVYTVLRTDVPATEWKCKSSMRGSDSYDQYVPLRERCVGGGATSPTVADALAHAGHAPEHEARLQRRTELWEAADAAGQPFPVDSLRGAMALTRAGYEAACAAIGVEPAPDDKVAADASSLATSDWDLYLYTPEHGVWADLTVRRSRGLAADQDQLDQAARQAAHDVVGPEGPLSREQYEAACRAAGVTPFADRSVKTAGYDPQAEIAAFGIADVGLALSVQKALGPYPKTSEHLASRRAEGIRAELVQRRQDERAALPADFEFATPGQVREIQALLCQDIGGGFFNGPTDTEGIKNMSREDASMYIDSLRGDY